MKTPYFVMLNSQDGEILIPMMDLDGNLEMFETEQEAQDAALSTVFGEDFGFEIFEAGGGTVLY